MKDIDIVILSNTADINYYKMLKQCIMSIKSNKDINTHIIVVETNKNLKGKDLKLPIDVLYIPDETEFNYNKFLNYGIQHCKHDFICISNNDVIYESNTLNGLVGCLDRYDSVSPWDNNVSWKYHSTRDTYEGYETTEHLTGWCIVTKRNTLEKIGGSFDERFAFWYQDDDYAELLKKNNLIHALVGDVSVYHLGQQSLKLFGNKVSKMTHGLLDKFNQKWKSQ